MDEYKEALTPILKELVSKYGLDETLDYISGIAIYIDFENMIKEQKEKNND